MGKWKLVIRASLRRLNCPAHGVLVEQVPFARHRSGLTRDFEDLVAYFATKTDKTAITRILRIDWDTVGRACERVVADGLDPGRLDGLVNIGVDEVSWRKHHRYLTLVTDHAAGKIVWGAEGKDTATLDAFFDDLGSEGSAALQAVSMDMGPAFAKSVTAPGHAPQAIICIDPFHAVKLVGDALDVLRRQTWNELRQLPDQAAARKFKGARWSLMKKPENLTDAIDARDSRVIPISKPTDEEKAHHYLWRFWRHVPRAGMATIYDRSWYGRVLVERLEGFAREVEWRRAYSEMNEFERELVEHGVIVIKFWLHISKEEQLRRFRNREDTDYKRHKINDEDWRNRRKWAAYETAVGDMIALTQTRFAPWHLIPANNKRHARLEIIKTSCQMIEAALAAKK